ncbi:hypothetical protein WJX81_002451 [Elliptochloris bilobata]|uniref:Uncharacterized protein n=1 Tax=Elliptochloris bilobata TaxID=381761 RepID=A0AAW1SDF4_9CHLO
MNAGKSTQYRDADGSMLSFKQVLLRSRALEASVERCLARGVGGEGQSGALAAVLGGFLAADSPAPGLVASAVVQLAPLLGVWAEDLLPASQAAAAAAVTALKASAGAEAPAPHGARIAELDRRAGDLASAFAREQSAREQARLAGQLAALAGQRWDLAVGADAGAGSGSVHKAAACADSLAALFGQRLEEARGGRAVREAALRAEDTRLGEQTHDLASQIQALEEQLQALRNSTAAVAARRERVAAQLEAGVPEPLEALANAQVALAAAHQLQSAAAAAVADEDDSACADASAHAESYVGTVENALAANVRLLRELGGSIKFHLARLAAATANKAQAARLGLAADAEKAARGQEQAERTLQEMLALAREQARASAALAASALLRFLLFAHQVFQA